MKESIISVLKINSRYLQSRRLKGDCNAALAEKPYTFFDAIKFLQLTSGASLLPKIIKYAIVVTSSRHSAVI